MFEKASKQSRRQIVHDNLRKSNESKQYCVMIMCRFLYQPFHSFVITFCQVCFGRVGLVVVLVMMKGLSQKGVWLTDGVCVCGRERSVCGGDTSWHALHPLPYDAFDVNDRSVHGLATEDHSMWKFHSSFCHGCEIPYRSSCHGSCFHCCWTQRCSLTRCHCSGISLSLLLPPSTTNTILIS